MSLCNGSEELINNYLPSLLPNQGDEISVGNGNWSLTRGTVFQHWCHFEAISRLGHYLIGTLLIFICVASVSGNALVVLVFTRFRRMRSPANTLIVNLAVSDLMNGFLHPMAAYSSFMETWMFGKPGCQLYAFLCGLFGLVSIVTLAAIALERCLVISVKPWYGDIQMTNNKTKYVIMTIWTYCAISVIPPLIGWGAFVPEAFLTSCSFDYISRTFQNRTYFVYLFALGFILPVVVIVVCYAFIIRTIHINEKNMKRNNVNKVYAPQIPRRRNDYKAAEMVMIVIAMFLISWTPYSVIATIGQFGDAEILTPWVSVLPSVFAKMATIYNPAIYGLSHRYFRATLQKMFKKRENPRSADKVLTRLSKTSIPYKHRPHCPCMKNVNASDPKEPSSVSSSGRKYYIGATIPEAARCHKTVLSAPDVGYQSATTLTIRDNKTPKRVTDLNHAVLTTEQNPDSLTLIRKLLFRSDSSLYQKYQTILENDQIIRLWTGTCLCWNNTLKNPVNTTEISIERYLKPTSSSLQVGNLTSPSCSTTSPTPGGCFLHRSGIKTIRKTVSNERVGHGLYNSHYHDCLNYGTMI